MADANTTTAAGGTTAGNGRLVTGIVTRDKNDKTRRVEIDRLVRHTQYGKFVKQKTVCYVHDEANDARLGDTVEIRECRPMSRTKRWTLVRVVKRAPSRTLSNLEGAVAGSDAGQTSTGSTPPPDAPTSK